MNEEKAQVIIDGVNAFANEIKAHESSFQKPVVTDLFPALLRVLKGEPFTGTWNKLANQEFYKAIGACNVDGKPLKFYDNNNKSLNYNREMFRIGVGLDYILRYVKKNLIFKVSYWPKVNICPRQHLAVNKDYKIIRHLSDYHTLLRNLLSKGVNFGTPSLDIFPKLTLTMMALDGLTDGLADRKIASLRVNDIYLDKCNPYVAIVIGKKKSAFKQYFIGSHTIQYLKIIKQRADKNGCIFPLSWTQSNNHKKTERRRCLENVLHALWRDSFPERNIPSWLNVMFWRSASRQSMEILGVPYLCIATLNNQVRGAQLPMQTSNSSSLDMGDCDDEFEIEEEYFLLKLFAKKVKEYDKKTNLGKIKRQLKISFINFMKEYQNSHKISINEQKVAEWIIWMLEQKDFSKMTLSTFGGYICTLKNRVIPLLHGKSFQSLVSSDWGVLVENVAQNEDYMPSSRRQALTHLSRFHAFLRIGDSCIPTIDFRSYRYRISREFAECDVIFPHEVDQLLEDFTLGSGVWLGILFGFYCGLRCEEISYLKVKDLDDEYKLIIGRSKLKSSQRTLPYSLLIPPNHMHQLRKVLAYRKSSGDEWLVCDGMCLPISTDLLSKRVGRALKKHGCRIQKMHALRHGFASWLLVRYFMLVDDKFRENVCSGLFHPEIDIKHPIFSTEMLAWYAEILGGAPWVHDFTIGNCHATSSDMVLISKLLGHLNRFTTLENYTNTLGWIIRFYLQQREQKMIKGDLPDGHKA